MNNKEQEWCERVSKYIITSLPELEGEVFKIKVQLTKVTNGTDEGWKVEYWINEQ